MAATRMVFVSEEEKQIAGPELINSSGTKSNRGLESSRSDGDKKKSKLDADKEKPEIDYDSLDYDNFPVKQWMQQFRKRRWITRGGSERAGYVYK